MVYRFLGVWQIFLGFDQHLLQFTGPVLSLHPLFLHSSCDQRCRKCVLINWFPTNNDYSSVFNIEWTNVKNIFSYHKKCWCSKLTWWNKSLHKCLFFKQNKIFGVWSCLEQWWGKNVHVWRFLQFWQLSPLEQEIWRFYQSAPWVPWPSPPVSRPLTSVL